MAVDYYDLGRTEGRISKRQDTADAHLGFLGIGQKSLSFADDIVSYVTEEKARVEEETYQQNAAVMTEGIGEMIDKGLEALTLMPEVQSNPDLYMQEANFIIERAKDPDQVYAMFADKGVTMDQVNRFLSGDQGRKLITAGETARDVYVTNVMRTGWQSTLNTNITTAVKGASSIEDAEGLVSQVYADSGNTAILDPYGAMDPSRPANRASWAAAYYLSDAEDRLPGLISSDPYADPKDVVSGLISEYDSYVGDVSGLSPKDQASVATTRDTLEEGLLSLVSSAQDNYIANVSNALKSIEASIGLDIDSGTATVDDLLSAIMQAGLDGVTGEQQASILDWVTRIAAASGSLSEVSSEFARLSGISARYGFRPKVDDDDPYAVGYAFLFSDEYEMQDANDVRPSSDAASDSLVESLLQRASDIIAERATELYEKDKGDNMDDLVDDILYDFSLTDEEKYDALDYQLYMGTISDEKYSEAIGDVGKVNSSYKEAASTTLDQIGQYISTLGLEGTDKAKLEYEVEYGSGKKAIYGLVSRANGNVPQRQDLEAFVDSMSDAMFQEDFFDDYYRLVGNVINSGSRDGYKRYSTEYAKTGTLDDYDAVESLLFSGDREDSLTTFYQHYNSGQYSAMVDKDALALTRDMLRNSRNEATSRKALTEDVADRMYGRPYSELGTWEKNCVEVTATAAFCEAVQVADLANCMDRGEGIDVEYAEVNVPGFGKGLLTKGGLLLYSRPYDLENTWGGKQYLYCLVDVTSDQYRSVWGVDPDRENAVVIPDTVKTRSVVMPKDKDGGYMPLSESTALWRYMLRDDYGAIEKFGKLARNTPR